MNRRPLLRATALIPVALALAACPGGSVATTQIAQYATVAENAAAELLMQFTPSATTATVAQYLADVKTAAAALLANAPAAGASWQQQLYDAIKAVLPIAAPLLGTVPGMSLGLAALQAILPVVASWLGLVGVARMSLPLVPPMTPEQALKLYGQ